VVLSVDVSVKCVLAKEWKELGRSLPFMSHHFRSVLICHPLEIILVLQVVVVGTLSLSEILSPQEKYNLAIVNC